MIVVVVVVEASAAPVAAPESNEDTFSGAATVGPLEATPLGASAA